MNDDDPAVYLLADVADRLGCGEVPLEMWEAALQVVRVHLEDPLPKVAR